MTRRQAALLAIVLGLSLAVKLAGVVYMNQYLGWNIVAPDTRDTYRPLAVNLLNGRGYQITNDFRNVSRVAPVFSYYLAGVYAVLGTDVAPWELGILNALLRTATTLLVFLLARRAFGERAGLAAAALHAIDPWEAFWSGFVLKETQAVLLSVLAIYLIVVALERPSVLRGVAAGVALAVASLARFATLGLIPWTVLAIAAAALRRRVAWGAALETIVGLSLGVAVGLAPWVAHNQRVGMPLLYTRAGIYFFVSNGPGAERAPDTWGYSGASIGDRQAALDMLPPKTTYAQRQRLLITGTLAHLAAHPGTAVRLVTARMVNMWRPTFAGSSTFNLLVLGVPYCLLMAAALAGLAAGWRRVPDEQARARLVLYAVVGFYVALHVLYWSEIRYRQYAMPILTVFAGYAVSRLIDRRSAPAVDSPA